MIKIKTQYHVQTHALQDNEKSEVDLDKCIQRVPSLQQFTNLVLQNKNQSW